MEGIVSAELVPEVVPGWLAPRDGYTASSFLAEKRLPTHTELIDGGLVFVAPQRYSHMHTIDVVKAALSKAAPAGHVVVREMAVVLSDRTVVAPDIAIVRAGEVSDDLTWFDRRDVVLTVEVVSPDSEERDRDTKPHKYARAGIPHYWLVEHADEGPLVRTFVLDVERGEYRSTGVHQGRLTVTEPFPIDAPLS